MNAMTTRAGAACLALACGIALGGCAGMDSRAPAARPDPLSVPGGFPGQLFGYLAPAALPASLALVPPPPDDGSAAQALDDDVSRRSFALRGTPRWTLAASDADLRFPHAAGTFSCALGARVSEADTPQLYRLLRRTLTDLAGATSAAKIRYARARPFMRNGQPLCTPQDRHALENDGSYPSGHTAAGWGWALILAEISPTQADALLLRGRSFGESRNVCNVHWHSDVVEARNLAAGVVARLHADPAFRADLDAAAAELATVGARSLGPLRDCATEAAALAATPSLAR